MVMLDLNLPPVDEEEVAFVEGLNSEKPKTEIDYKRFPIKKRILMLWKEKKEPETKLLLSLRPKKRQKVESAVCFKPKAPPLTGKRQKAKTEIKNSCRSFDASKLLPDYVKNNPEFQGMTEVKLVIQKTLKRADILRRQDRLSIPYKKIMTNFLTDSEFNWLEIQRPGNGKRKTVVVVKVIGPCSNNIHKMSLSRWNYKGRGYKFVITSGWTSFLNENNLKLNDFIQVVTFRVNSRLCFVILKPNTSSSSMTT